MKIYILRHGHSPGILDSGVTSDADRPLSPLGRRTSKRAAEYLVEKGCKPGLILHSPLKRALQSSEEVARVFKPSLETRVYDPLANRMTGEDLFRHLIEDDIAPEVLVVGHQPQLGEMAAFLTGIYFELQPAGTDLDIIER